MKPYYEDGAVTIYHGDALAVLRELPDCSVQCCVTSPPYWGLRSYLPDVVTPVEGAPKWVFDELKNIGVLPLDHTVE